MGNAKNKGSETKQPEALLLKNERVVFWGYIAEKCPRCQLHQPFEIYAFDASFFNAKNDYVLARDWKQLAYIGACPVYEPELNPDAAYLHVCTFCNHISRVEKAPQANVDIFWEPVDRFRILAETTALDRDYLDEKREVSSEAASKFFRSVKGDPRFADGLDLVPLASGLLSILILGAIYAGLRATPVQSGLDSPALLGIPFALGGIGGILAICLFLKRRRQHSLASLMLILLYPFSLELPPILQHAKKDSKSKSIAKALKTLVDAMENTEEAKA
jgi:hypothetical protein